MQRAGPDGKPLVAYYRVSTQKQGESGLGLEAQQAIVEGYGRASGRKIIAAYVEVESGADDSRPELARAEAHARRASATVAVAKLDRISRDVHFVTGLQKRGVDWIDCGSPHDDPFIRNIKASFAEEERKKISGRVGDALAAFKANGRVPKRIRDMYPGGVPPEVAERYAGKLGAAHPDCRKLTAEQSAAGRRRSAVVRRDRAAAAYVDLVPAMRELRAEGRSDRAIAAELNRQGHSTRRGRPWNGVQVARVLDRAAAAAPPVRPVVAESTTPTPSVAELRALLRAALQQQRRTEAAG
jgi:DNA invertase Pin-like site-specific DNA recombinase